MSEYKVYKAKNGRTYISVSAEIRPDNALKIANQYLKESTKNIKVEAGYEIGKDLYLGYPDSKKARPVWVVTRK